MFDIGFLEIALIAVVALLVVGPERLPDAVKSSIRLITKFKRFMRETKQEIETQIGADDIRRELHNEEVLKSIEALKTAQKDIESTAKVISRDITDDPTRDTDDNIFTDPNSAHPVEDDANGSEDSLTHQQDIEKSQKQNDTTLANSNASIDASTATLAQQFDENAFEDEKLKDDQPEIKQNDARR